MPPDSRDAGHGGSRNPEPPRRGDLFQIRTPDGPCFLTVQEREADFYPLHTYARFIVRDTSGARWVLVSRDGSLDGCRYYGEPAPIEE